MPFLKSLCLDGILSFPPGSEAIPLTPLNVLIGPNGSGKSNLIEGIELLHATPTGFASAIRDGGGVSEWLWKGEGPDGTGNIEAQIGISSIDQALSKALGIGELPAIRHKLSFTAVGQRLEITDESIEDLGYANDQLTEEQTWLRPVQLDANPFEGARFYYHFQDGKPVVNAKTSWPSKKIVGREKRNLDRRNLKADESILMQLKDPWVYPELTALGRKFENIRTFREWTFGRNAAVRRPQPTDLPNDVLSPDSRNLGLILSQLENSGAWAEFNSYLTRFLPRFQRYSTRIEGGTVQFYLHESGLKAPVPATRLSDGTIRFIAILAQLLSPTPPPLICMEEPELGLHPDAIALLAGLLHQASARTQLIVTTHSDALVSALTEYADSVLVCEYRGGTTLQRIDSAKLQFWLEKYKLGEIWRIGEIGGNL